MGNVVYIDDVKKPEPNLDPIREMVRVAFSGCAPYSSSPLADFATTNRKPIRKLSKNKRSERNVNQWPETASGKESIKPSFSRPLITKNPNAWVIRRINELPELPQVVLRHMYKTEPSKWYGERICQLLWPVISQTEEVKGRRPEIINKARLMLEAQVKCCNHPIMYAGLLSKPWDNLGIDKQAWYRAKLNHLWVKITNTIKDADRNALLMIEDTSNRK